MGATRWALAAGVMAGLTACGGTGLNPDQAIFEAIAIAKRAKQGRAASAPVAGPAELRAPEEATCPLGLVVTADAPDVVCQCPGQHATQVVFEKGRCEALEALEGRLPCPEGARAVADPERVSLWCERADGTLDGPTVQYWPYGPPRLAGYYFGGRREGTTVGWHANGRRHWVGELVDGAPDGGWDWFDAEGRPVGSVELVGGSGAWVEWGPGGEKLMEGAYLDGKRHGQWQVWGRDGRVVGTNTLERGTGTWRQWDEAGRLVSEATLVGDVHDGPFKAWDADGSLEGIFAQGVRVGRWLQRDPGGALLAGACYRAGQQVWLAEGADEATTRPCP